MVVFFYGDDMKIIIGIFILTAILISIVVVGIKNNKTESIPEKECFYGCPSVTERTR